MSNEKTVSRRAAMGSLVMVATGTALLACGKKELACTDTAGLSPEEATLRTTVEYVDKSPVPPNQCDSCQLYKPAAPETCGACTVVKGPINPRGYCKSWVQRQPT